MSPLKRRRPTDTPINLPGGRTGWLRDRARAADPALAAELRAQLAALRAAEPQPPPPTPEQLAYRKALAEWRKEKEALTGALFDATEPRYRVVEDHGVFAHVVCYGENKEEVLKKAREMLQGVPR